MNAQQIIARLAELGISRYRISKETGITQSALTRLNTGERKCGSHATNVKLQALLALKETDEKSSKAL